MNKNKYELELMFVHFKPMPSDYYVYNPDFKQFSRIKFFLKDKGEFNLIDEELSKFLEILERVANEPNRKN